MTRSWRLPLHLSYLTIAHKISRVWCPGTHCWYSIWWCTGSTHSPNWNKTFITPEDDLGTIHYTDALEVLNGTIPRGTGYSTVDWKGRKLIEILIHYVGVSDSQIFTLPMNQTRLHYCYFAASLLQLLRTQYQKLCVEWRSTNTGWHLNIHYGKIFCTHLNLVSCPPSSHTCEKEGLVFWATFLVTWGRVAPRSESLNQIAEHMIICVKNIISLPCHFGL